ncbi:Butyryl-CoA dehydrogenase [uncultured Desulfatiglans sp.]|uniref:Acyl-[acyl-carrier-protein] dehydrogenase MbtN n=1 Tax=Uncultured Desulfatiglans sp. TaxID=1748965 RepID=A0A653A3Z5_UNCDX|nr:Butyryl-CoA dehydrogenase [uncultured Desulfatiglans sp.]
MTDSLYTEEHQIFRDAFRKFVAKEITPNVEQWEADRAVPRDLWLKMGEQGYLCPWLPEQYGGLGLGFEYSVIINEELIRGDGFGVGVPLHSDVATPYVHSYATPEMKERWLPGCATGEVITSIGLTEPNAGSDLAAIRTTARRDGDSYVLNGQKTFITNGYFADLVVVAAKTDPKAGHRGVSLILVDKDAPGFHRGRRLEKMGYHMQDTAELFFEDCRVPASHLLGAEGAGFKYMMEKLQRERLEVCIKCQVNAEEALKEGLNYAKVREAFGRPIGNFQYTAFRLAEMATDVELGRVFLDHLIRRHIEGNDITQQVSMAKYWLGEMVNRVAYQALQIHGGYGYMEEYRICRISRDVRSLSIFAGTSEIMKLIVSRNLGLTPQ